MTLIVFLSDIYIDGDQGCDAFGSPVEGEAVFAKLRTREELVELILADDSLDFMRLGTFLRG